MSTIYLFIYFLVNTTFIVHLIIKSKYLRILYIAQTIEVLILIEIYALHSMTLFE